MSRSLQELSDNTARLAHEASKAHRRLAEALADLGAALANAELPTEPELTYKGRVHLPWSTEEEAIVSEHYARGAAVVRSKLLAAGHPTRTIAAIQTKGKNLKLRISRAAQAETITQQILAVIRDYRGMPLTVDDVRDEVGNLSRARAHRLLDELVTNQQIAERSQPDGARVWYDHTAEREEAA